MNAKRVSGEGAPLQVPQRASAVSTIVRRCGKERCNSRDPRLQFCDRLPLMTILCWSWAVSCLHGGISVHCSRPPG